MKNATVEALCGRMSLRVPQREALDVLARAVEAAQPKRGTNLVEALAAIKAACPTLEDFERDFPSLCFNLATGVGKTRLMGACIAYLFKERGFRDFFVLAPNLTIYEKLVRDFSPNTPKYVFQGVGDFAATPPEVITGDTYERGHGVRAPGLFGSEAVHINIFNISKINSEVRGGKAPRMKRLQEYIGTSYFEYLADLPDLVLLMDESHRYRASAGVRVLNELNPVLGLEFTATPQVQAGGAVVPFKNVVYSYPLSEALKDGFVKEPAVATRQDFRAADFKGDDEALERVKLEDGIHIHEDVKLKLERFARENDRPPVKPFILVVAQDVAHADALLRLIESEGFFEGRYKGKVITVHSKQAGEEADEFVGRLLRVEDPAEPTEVVIHVAKLQEGWDVTNLYTVVPLRAFSSRTLVEQSIGRGLRLPYGRRTGVPAVDRLTIVAHEHFQAIIEDAQRPESIFKTGVVVGRDVPVSRSVLVEMEPMIAKVIRGVPVPGMKQAEIPFRTPAEQSIAKLAVEAIGRLERLPTSEALKKPEIHAEIVRLVKAAQGPKQLELAGITGPEDVEKVVRETARLYVERTIDIPRIYMEPEGVTTGFKDFDLDVASFEALEPVPENILLQSLRTSERETLLSGGGIAAEGRLEDYIIAGLMDFDDVDYSAHSDLMYKLAGQAVEALRQRLKEEDACRNVLLYHHARILNEVHAQMLSHRWESAVSYTAKVSKGFKGPRSRPAEIRFGEKALNFRAPVDAKALIRGMLFDGFDRCLYDCQRFQSDPERRFAVLLEDEKQPLKWFKPSTGDFAISWGHERYYEPDFVVETETLKLICEPKREDLIKDAEVVEKAKAATEWCRQATAHAVEHKSKPWEYLLLPGSAITAAATLDGLRRAHGRPAK